MSTRARRHDPLREVSRGMSTPLPDRTRFLRELASDLHDLTERLVEAGHSRAEAQRRAEEAMLPDATSLAALERIHASWYRRLTSRVEPGRLGRIERVGLVGVTLLLVATEAAALVSAGLWRGASAFLWPVLALASVMLIVAAAKGFQLWVKRDHSRPRRGLSAIPVLVVATVVTATVGVFVDAMAMASAIERAPQAAERIFFDWLFADAALVSVAILTSLVGGLAWLVTSHWLVHVEVAHEQALRMNVRPTPVPHTEALP